MMSNHQEEFIGRIRNALGVSGQDSAARAAAVFTPRTPVPQTQKPILATVRSRNREARLALLDRLIEEGKPLNLSVTRVKDGAEAAKAIARLVAETSPEWGGRKQVVQWDHALIQSLNLAGALKDQQVPVHTAAFDHTETDTAARAGRRKEIRQQVMDAYLGVTSADFCLADTGTLVMRSRPGEARSVSLLPAIHVAVISLDQILFDLKELYALLKWDPQSPDLPHHMVFISGPSKTADIELTMVHGAHGPRAVQIFVITG